VNILIVKLSALGDVVHTLPALNALRRQYPGAHISWLVEARAREILEGHVSLDRVIVWQRRDFEAAFKSGRWVTAVRIFLTTLREVRQFPFDLVIDFQGLLKSGIWTGFARGRRKAGFGRGMERSEGSHLFLTDRVPAVSMDIHAIERSLLLLEAIGVPRGPIEYGFPSNPAVQDRVTALLAANGIAASDPVVAIHPMTRWPTKLWYEDRFASVADQLQDRRIKVVFSGGPADGPALDKIASAMHTPMIRLPPTEGLKVLAALYARARVVVATDTGPMHIAAAVGTPVVALFGPTSPDRTGPYGNHHVVLRSGVPCSPCYRRKCVAREVEELACMKRIQPVQVLSAVQTFLNPVAGPARS
jgi:heptosyltransferase-1